MWGKKGYKQFKDESDIEDQKREAELRKQKEKQQKEEEDWNKFCQQRLKDAEKKEKEKNLMKF